MKKIAACAMCMAASASMVLNGTALAAPGDIQDGAWYEPYMQSFISQGYLRGYGNDTYKPEQEITRSEFAALTNRVEKYQEMADISRFTDVNPEDWFYEDFAKSVKAGIIHGVSNTSLSPNGMITREQAFTIIARVLGVSSENTDVLKNYADGDKVSSWADHETAALIEAGIVSGDGVGLKPKDTLKRSEAVKLLSEALGVQEQENSLYLMMNIPYDKFYAAEVSNDVAVDVVTSATANKWKNMYPTSYHKELETGGQILGVTFPVKVSETNAEKLSKDLAENADYYYTALENEPAAYKELTIAEDGSYVFGAVQGAAAAVEDAAAVLTTSSGYGDYQLNVNGISFGKVYGAVITTKEGTSYGLRALENIWRSGAQLAWSCGIKTTENHGNTLSSAHYADMMGKTITGVTYFTDAGIQTVNCGEIYVPVKTTASVKIESADWKTGTAAVDIADMPRDFAAEYQVYQVVRQGRTMTLNEQDIVAYQKGVMSWDKSNTNAVNSYRLVIRDTAGKYADITADFSITAEPVYVTMNVPYDAFYKSDVKGNTGTVDVMTSATRSKLADCRTTGKKYSGTYTDYNAEDAAQETAHIFGVTYPVAMGDNVYAVLKGKVTDVNADYYFEDHEGVPAAYKTMTVNADGTYSFGAAQGTKTAIEGAALTNLTASTNWGDYQLTMTDLGLTQADTTFYGVIINTKDENGKACDYGLRMGENIWLPKMQLAWSAGFVTTAKGCPLSYAYYESMMGNTITGVTLLTDKGTYTVAAQEGGIYVPIKTKMAVKVEDTGVNVGSAVIGVEEMPEDFAAEYVILKAEGEGRRVTYVEQSDVTVGENNVISWDKNKTDLVGTYRLTVSDKNGKYASVSSNFNITEAAEPQAVTATAEVSDTDPNAEDEFAAYHVTVSYQLEDGKIADLEITSDVTDESSSYFKKASAGNAKVTGMAEKLTGKTLAEVAEIDTVSGATVTSKAIKTAIQNAK